MELREVVLEVLPLLVPLIDHRKQRLEVIDRGEAHIVSADPRRVAQILINLILHASDHGGEGSTIGLHLRPRESSARVSIVDPGLGIPEGGLPGRFELFHRPTDAIGSGSPALGLATVRALVEAHGGKVGVRNRSSGGTRVWFELPRPRSRPSKVVVES